MRISRFSRCPRRCNWRTLLSCAVSGALSAGFIQLSGVSAWGVDGEVTVGIGANDKIRLNGAYGANAFIGGTAGAKPAVRVTVRLPASLC